MVDWVEVMNAIRRRRAVSLAVPESEVETVLKIVEEYVAAEDLQSPTWLYDAPTGRLWLWSSLLFLGEFTEPDESQPKQPVQLVQLLFGTRPD